MRLPTFSVRALFKRRIALAAAALAAPNRRNQTIYTADANLLERSADCVQVSPAWPESEGAEVREAVLGDMLVMRDFVSPAEERGLHDELEPYLKKMRYEFDHWDDAIHGFRETERTSWSDGNSEVISRVVSAAFPRGADALQHTHVLDLAPEGYIKPHVDAVRFCGRVIAGICLLSDAVMRLVHTEHRNRVVDVLLPRRSLYIMKDTARYDYTHEVLPQAASEFGGRPVVRTRRISVICRSTPEPSRQLPE